MKGAKFLKKQYIPYHMNDSTYIKLKKLVNVIMLKISIMINFGMFRNLKGASEVLIVFFDLGIGSIDVFTR